MEKHEFKTGDGMCINTSTPEERKEIYRLMEEKEYHILRPFINRPESDWDSAFAMFNEWGTEKITYGTAMRVNKPYTYKEMLSLIGESKTIKVSREFILKAYESACTEWKGNIEAAIPELFSKKIGYYVDKKDSNWLGYLNVEGTFKCLISLSNDWVDEAIINTIDNFKLATTKEIEERLWIMADKLGLKDAKFICEPSGKQPSGSYFNSYYPRRDMLFNRFGCIYEKGKWATPLDEMDEDLKKLIDKLGKEQVLKWLNE